MSVTKRLAERRTDRKKSKPSKPLSTPIFAENFPELFKFLEIPRRSEQGFTTGSMSIFFEDRVFKVCLNDRPEKRSAFVSSESLSKAFKLADAGLMSNSIAWRSKGYVVHPNGKRRK